MKRLLVVASMVMSASAALAGSPFSGTTDAQKRKVVVPYIKSLTGCVAQQALNDPEAVTVYRQGIFNYYIAHQLQKCPREMNALLETYESTYGEGEAERFIKGPYLSDLSRAVLSLIQPQIDAKVADAKQHEFMQKRIEEEEALEAQQKVAEDKAAATKAQSEQKTAEAKARQDKQERIDTAMRAMSILRDKFYDCVDQQLPGIVKSGETADVLASAAMTICGKALADVQDAAVEVAKAKDEPIDGEEGEPFLRSQVKSLVKERVIADAVQAKAGVGAFSTSH